MRGWPLRGWIGLGLVAFGWIGNWSMEGLRTHLLFFPLWLGYCLTVDALVFVRKGASMFARSRRAYVGLFLVSAPAWWLFELIDWRTQNWFYDGREAFTDLQYFLLASLSFSTVIPAVFGTAELIGASSWLGRLRGRATPLPRRTGSIRLFAAGWVMLALLLLWPRCFFPFAWLSLFLILDPVNAWLGNRSLLAYLRAGDWRPVFALGLGALVCGFFWEMWNYYSYPKWIYRVPFVGFCKVFEMPLLGYLGYIPFALELFALYHLVARFTSGQGSGDFVAICESRVQGGRGD